MKLEQRRLGRTGLKVSRLGFGAGPIGNASVAPADAAAAVRAAFDSGIRYFDTAPSYGRGHAEHRLGLGLKGVPRADYVLSTKVGRLLEPADPLATTGPAAIVYDYSRDGARRALAESLARIGSDHIDVALIHDIDRWTHGERQPEIFRAAVEGAFRGLADLRAEGVVGAVGVGINESDLAERAIRVMDLDVVLLASRYTLLEQGALAGFLPECVKRNVSVVIGAPYNSGVLATGPVDGALYDYAPALPALLGRVRHMERVCRSHDVPLIAAALQFPLLHPAVATTVPGVVSVAEVERTLALFQMDIPGELWRDLRTERLLSVDAPVD